MKAVDGNIKTNKIETCHCLGKKNVIVRAINRKHCLKALRNKKKIMSIDKNALGISNANLFVSENLTPTNSKLAFNCRKLKKATLLMELPTSQKIIN